MPLCKLARLDDLKDGGVIIKEAYNRGLVVTTQDGQPICIEVPDVAMATQDISVLRAVGKTHHIYRDKDGELWINLAGCDASARAPQQQQPAQQQQYQQPPAGVARPLSGDPYAGVVGAMPPGSYPTPLVPFAGCDKKAPPPSPAKPYSLAASPLKPSPFKERVDIATEAVARKNWGSRQAKLGEFFGRAPASKAHSEPAQHISFMDTDF